MSRLKHVVKAIRSSKGYYYKKHVIKSYIKLLKDDKKVSPEVISKIHQ